MTKVAIVALAGDLQLSVARSVGLTVPRTLISTDPTAVREFTCSHGGTVIAKTLTGLLGTSLEAGQVTLDSLANDDEISVSATVYQEEIPGTDHLRVMVFGDKVHTARIRSGELDWRLANDMEVEPVVIDPRLGERLREVTVRLGLRMGVFDVKLRPDGEPIFLEVNPQGQFLFVEGMSDMPLGEAFAESTSWPQCERACLPDLFRCQSLTASDPAVRDGFRDGRVDAQLRRGAGVGYAPRHVSPRGSCRTDPGPCRGLLHADVDHLHSLGQPDRYVHGRRLDKHPFRHRRSDTEHHCG